MSRYIDADKLLDRIHNPYEMAAVARWVNEAPTADVRENVRWVFCNTSEPETSGDYLLYRPHFWGANKGQITVCYWNCHEWSDNYRNDAERYLPVIDGMAWMPLPEPYKEDEGEKRD